MLRERESRPAGIYALAAGGRDQPLGIPADRPRLSWAVGSDTEIDAAAGFDVGVFDDATDAGEVLWAGHTERPWVNYGGPALPSRARRRWRVEATTTAGERIAAESTFEVGLRSAADWAARWITAPELPFRRESWDPAPYLRQELEMDAGGEPPVVARVYASALGLYRLWLNGIELTEDALLRPGWTDYRIRVYHQTFDASAALRPGINVLTAVLAGGWYSGRIGLQREPKFYGDRPALLAQLELEGADGARRTVATDADWRAGYGRSRRPTCCAASTRTCARSPRAGASRPSTPPPGTPPSSPRHRRARSSRSRTTRSRATRSAPASWSPSTPAAGRSTTSARTSSAGPGSTRRSSRPAS